MARCNPYGYGTDAGPRHLMGGRYGPEYAGDDMLVDSSGARGLGICQREATGRYRMVCRRADHARGRVLELCDYHVQWITGHYLQTCTACAMPAESIALELEMEACMRELQGAAASGDWAATGRLRSKLESQRRAMDELVARGVIRPRQPLELVMIS